MLGSRLLLSRQRHAALPGKAVPSNGLDTTRCVCHSSRRDAVEAHLKDPNIRCRTSVVAFATTENNSKRLLQQGGHGQQVLGY